MIYSSIQRFMQWLPIDVKLLCVRGSLFGSACHDGHGSSSVHATESIRTMARTKAKTLLTILLTLFFVTIGILHFTHPQVFVKSVPPYVPMPLEMVYVSGVFEIIGGIGVSIPAVRKWAGYGLLALLVAVYPANIHMALNPEQFPTIPPVVLWGRLPFQALFMAWVWYCAISSLNRERHDLNSTS